MLTLIATPIGNLGDISKRALEVLGSCDAILCEDTRHSLGLLRHFGLEKPLISYHKFNEASSAANLIEEMQAGKHYALISDAGTPGINDPGQRLVAACQEAGVRVSCVPGPCAAISALACSGLPTERFQFLGFVARKESQIEQVLRSALSYPGTSIFYESARRLVDTLEILARLAPQHPCCVARELTKIYEEVRLGTCKDLLTHYTAHPPKGECVLMLGPQEASPDWDELPLATHVQELADKLGLSPKEAISEVANLRGIPKKQVYQAWLDAK